MTWSSKAAEAKQKALDFSDSVDSLRDSLKSLTLNQLLDKQQDYCDNLENIENQIDNVKSEIKALNREILEQEGTLGGSIQIIEENRKKL
ncbi:hypothetical protein [uncultured Gilliamella sp.]|uniref:hypothetical protein n=1 Tax=uncultured Gilliamella sp. TaxID=1193505 RepID=UPI0025DDA141|nr:hypothetical protein [uncultured Gilliamella sp.]